LAYFREAVEFRNLLMMELPRGDFAFTTTRQFLVSVFEALHLEQLQASRHSDLAGIAAKALKETRYHARHSADWMLKMGDGTAESHDRAQRAIDDLWRFTGELFESDESELALVAEGIAVDRRPLRDRWHKEVSRVLAAATLSVPDDGFMQRGGREGKHTEHLGHLLAEMQIVARSYPGAEW
jgi:ring-1,2-phenylacetyl-CoA epoxidase subunit PaaC